LHQDRVHNYGAGSSTNNREGRIDILENAAAIFDEEIDGEVLPPQSDGRCRRNNRRRGASQ
jgi:hypothetical protein